ncbi:prephenate dehydratase [Caldicellulosiruptor bescii]|uniref:Prephenate dehydratase n=2 Tax=Caldicellulosiruptor bescii TaxID=31899 RepID=B9MQN4_CALBD|nr:prephenate dehydratase [Caldicellulosiruptor bescii]ACM59988.1 Prephenate dehydratase [Caldicellulosiruptor bescii DSM 6725]PBC87407.1 prephenate dehydratase [Caldicellulosiruptor bescii]PBC90347.1 prephenate dehydratase [Caldicellulosiruptor bescii]PBD04227.1 prephenate dehydratase [Caldicellulosiruptor bescii]PBD06144.1 prephenate dehydratase [Caldicellulosiruptor bescii]
MKVAYLGPIGSYSYEAARRFFADEQEKNLVACDTIDDVFETVEENEVEFGVVPVENSIEGSVSTTLDYLLKSKVYIVKEIVLKVEHYLCAREEAKQILTIASHPQAFSQCHDYLRKNFKEAKLIQVSSTSYAARMCSGGDVDAAICSLFAAQQNNLKVLAGPINHDNNYTRFFVISKNPNFEKGEKNKTSIIFSTYDKPGSLYKILAIFNLYDLNLTKIESRPAKTNLGEYVFFVDIDGFVDDEDVNDALRVVQRKSTFFKLLGSYSVVCPDSENKN